MTGRPAGRDLAAPLANPRADRVKKVAALAGRSARQRASQVLVEGPQAVRELVTHRRAFVRDVYVREDLLGTSGAVADIAHDALAHGLFVHPVTPEVADALSPDAQGLCAVASADALVASLDGIDAPLLVAILSNVRDPGNAGTAIRVADAAGADAVILAGDSVDPGSPKVIRSSVGSVFHVPVVRMALPDAVEWSHARGLAVAAADVSGEVEIGSAASPDLGAPTAWLFGNEAWGLTREELAQADMALRIPIFGEAESLNLGTAVAVCLYQSALAARA